MMAAVISYHRHGRPMEGFWVREEIKAHGTQKQIEGGLKQGDRVVIVDVVFTKVHFLKAVEAARELGCEVVMVLALVDRLQGAAELFRQHGIEHYGSVFTIRDFGVGTEERCATETPTSQYRITVVEETAYPPDVGSRRWWVDRGSVGFHAAGEERGTEQPGQCQDVLQVVVRRRRPGVSGGRRCWTRRSR